MACIDNFRNKLGNRATEELSILRFSKYVHPTIQDGQQGNTGVLNVPIGTPNFNVLAIRASISQQPFNTPWGTTIDITFTFRDEGGTAVHSEDIALSSIFSPVSEKMYYNKENVIITGIKSIDIEYRIMTVDGHEVAGGLSTSVLVEMYYTPLRY